MDVTNILDLLVEIAQVVSALSPNETPALDAAVEKAKAAKETDDAKRPSH